jgi:hypothetical protein
MSDGCFSRDDSSSVPGAFPEDCSAAGAVVAHKRELQAAERKIDQRWPVPHAMRFIASVSVALWVMIIAAASWLIG